jgi:hypothetical protein
LRQLSSTGATFLALPCRSTNAIRLSENLDAFMAPSPCPASTWTQARDCVTSIFWARHQRTTTSFMKKLPLSKPAARSSQGDRLASQGVV